MSSAVPAVAGSCLGGRKTLALALCHLLQATYSARWVPGVATLGLVQLTPIPDK